MKGSVIYANSIIACKEGKLLRLQQVKRMLSAPTLIEAIKILYECGYDVGLIQNNPESIDSLIANEHEKTIKVFSGLCADSSLLRLVLLRYDYHNLKSVYKDSDDTLLYPFGNIAVKDMKAALTEKQRYLLTAHMQTALHELDTFAKENKVTSAEIELKLDKAMYSEFSELLKKIKSKTIKAYFTAEIDIQNILSFARTRVMDLPTRLAHDYFVAGGTLKKELVETIITLPPQKFSEKFINTPYYKFMQDLSSGIKNNSLADCEHNMWGYLLELSAKEKNNAFKLDPLFNWYIRKKEELKTIKLVLISKKLGLAPGVIEPKLKYYKT
ncbi:MAG: DUF2764 family protein [Firmicutes bacterium]|nr:DUF2764 family protein [Bacillota bacterium]